MPTVFSCSTAPSRCSVDIFHRPWVECAFSNGTIHSIGKTVSPHCEVCGRGRWRSWCVGSLQPILQGDRKFLPNSKQCWHDTTTLLEYILLFFFLAGRVWTRVRSILKCFCMSSRQIITFLSILCFHLFMTPSHTSSSFYVSLSSPLSLSLGIAFSSISFTGGCVPPVHWKPTPAAVSNSFWFKATHYHHQGVKVEKKIFRSCNSTHICLALKGFMCLT